VVVEAAAVGGLSVVFCDEKIWVRGFETVEAMDFSLVSIYLSMYT
jgi:hypothetical protein